MYIWIGCKLPEDFAAALRRECTPLLETPELDFSGFSLPQHISLKISFDAGERYEEVLDALANILQQENKFYVNMKAMERQGNILWIAFRPDATLRRLHEMLDRELYNRFGVEQHLFDKDFRFHTTLCMGTEEALIRAEELLGGTSLPNCLEVRSLMLGISETGRSGEYSVVREIFL